MSTESEKSAMSPITIKKEPITKDIVINNSRLTSFTLPRDLTLGGSGQLKIQRGTAKKVYTPNLNVVRNKNTNIKTSVVTSTFRGKEKFERGKSNQARGSHAKRDSLIQTAGVFSEGLGAGSLRKSLVSNSSSSRFDAGSDTLRKPTLTKRESNQSDPVLGRQDLKDILCDSGIEDFENQKIDLRNIPVKLTCENENTTQNLEKCSERYKTSYSENLEELLSKDESKLFILQLPDSLPCQNLVNEETEPNKIVQSNENKSFLKECEEGQIGRLLKYKSGKYRFVLGNTYFDLDLGMDPGFLQEVISINTYREQRSGNIINLGAVQAKITAIPDWKELFRNNTSNI